MRIITKFVALLFSVYGIATAQTVFTEAGGVVAKFWLTITKDEQLRRFRERQKTPFKNFKITTEDWRNRKKWDGYQRAVCDMIERTSNEAAPWFIIPANDKYYARIEVLRTLCERVAAAL